jgi:hypothetical protein
MVRDHLRKIKKARQRLVLCRLMIDMMRTVRGAYAPASERFGTRLETFFIALCVALGDIDGKPFSVAKIVSYVRVPGTTVIRKLNRLQSWGLIDRQGRHYYIPEKALNSLMGMRSYGTGPMHPEQGDTGIDRLGHFAGLTASVR